MHRIAIAAALALLALGPGGCASADAAREDEKAGLTALQQGRTEEAVERLERALDRDPTLYQSAMTLAMLAERSGDYGRAIDLLERLVENQPKLALAHMGLADLYARLGLYEKALAEYARVVAISSHPPALLAIAGIHLRRGEDARAERAILAALDAQPADLNARYALAKLYDERLKDERAAREAWQRFLAIALDAQSAREAERIAEARARLGVLAARLSPEEKAAALAAARDMLRPPPAGRAGETGREDGAVRGPVSLRRYFAGRVFVTLYAARRPAVRGSGRGATLLEAIAAAALDLKRSRVYELQYAMDLATARLALDIEAEEPAPLVLTAGEDGGPVAGAPGFRPGEEALEVKSGGRAAVVLPADQAAGRKGSLGAALGAAAAELGLARGAWRDLAVSKVRVVSFVEAADGGAGGAALALEGGLPLGPEATASEAVATARAAALWVASTLGPDGVFAEGYDPVEDRYQAGVTRSAVQLEAAAVLAKLGRRLGEPRLLDAAALAGRSLGRTLEDLERFPIAVQPLVAGADRPSREAVAGAARELMRLSVDEPASYIFREPARMIGAIRAGPLDPTVRTLEVVRRAAALAAAAEALAPEPKEARAPAR